MRVVKKNSKQQWDILIYTTVFVVFLLVVNTFIYHLEKKKLYEEFDSSNRVVVSLLTDLSKDALLSENYALIDWFFNHWGENQVSSIVELRLATDKGFYLADYAREFNGSDVTYYTRDIDLGNGHKYILEMTMSHDEIRGNLIDLLYQLLAVSTFATLLLAIISWQIINHLSISPLKKEIALREEAERKLSYQHDFLQNIIDTVSDGIMVIGESYEVLLSNRAAKNNFSFEQVQDRDHPKCYELSHHRSTPCSGDD